MVTCEVAALGYKKGRLLGAVIAQQHPLSSILDHTHLHIPSSTLCLSPTPESLFLVAASVFLAWMLVLRPS
jgi:hypothetical protein